MLYRFLISLLALVLVFNPLNLTGLFPLEKAYAATEGDALWARSTVVAPNESRFYDVETDLSGNIYAVGYIYGTGQVDFGNGVTVTGNCASSINAVIVKYNSEGIAQWARSTVVAPTTSTFNNVSTDFSGNIYAVGAINNNGQFDFGNGVIVSGARWGTNPVIVKYNSEGIAQWARSTVEASDDSQYLGITTDSSGSIYASGYIQADQYNFGNDITVSGGNDTSYNPVLVKYNSEGIAQWARSTVTGLSSSRFQSITADSFGNIYTSGYIYGSNQYNFGNDITVSGGNDTSDNPVLVKYNSEGIAQWARSTVEASDDSQYLGITTDSSGSIYASGYIQADQYNFGNDITVSGGNDTSYNPVLVKYNSEGIAQWARSTVTAPSSTWSWFNDVDTDSFGNVFVVGHLDYEDEYDFGNGVTISGGGVSWHCKLLIVKYNSSGEAQWARSIVSGLSGSQYQGIALDNNNDIYAAGQIGKNQEYGLGNGITVFGANANCSNTLLVKYTGPPPPEIIYQNLPDYAGPVNLEEGEVVTTPFFTIRVKPYSEVGIAKVEFYVDDNLLCTSFTPDENGVYSCIWDTTQYHSTIKIIAYDTLGNTEIFTRIVSVSLASTTEELTVLPKTGR